MFRAINMLHSQKLMLILNYTRNYTRYTYFLLFGAASYLRKSTIWFIFIKKMIKTNQTNIVIIHNVWENAVEIYSGWLKVFVRT